MLKTYTKKIKKIFLLAGIGCLSSLLSFSTTASSSNTTEFIPAINFLLDKPSEFGSLLPGKLYTTAELAFWRARADNGGPHIVRGDAYGTLATGSIPGFRFVQQRATALPNTHNSEIIITGKDVQYINRLEVVSVVTDPRTQITPEELEGIKYWGHCVISGTGRHQKYDSFEFGSIQIAQAAAFVDLINETSTHTERVKSILLAQAQRPCMDFNNRQIFPNGPNNTTFWLYYEWLHRVLKTYDYLDESVFTNTEKAIMENWFKGAADWSYYFLQARSVENAYLVRARNPINSVLDPNYQFHRDESTPSFYRYKGSGRFWPAGSLINNRETGQLNFIVHAGVKFNNPVWKLEGAKTVKEYIAFHFDDDGYFAELRRSNETTPMFSLGYAANTLLNMTEIAHILYHDGYEDLFAYKSRARINPDADFSDLRNGNGLTTIEAGPIERSLEWVFLQFRKNFMLRNAPNIYPLDLADDKESTDTVIHFCNSTKRTTSRFVGRMYQPAAIANRYYKNSKIKEMYNFNEDFGNICEFEDTILDIRSGPHSISPATLFQYSDADEDY